MVTYQTIVSELTENFTHFELENDKRQYNGFSLLQRHYYYHIKNRIKKNEIQIGMEELMDHVGAISDDKSSYSDYS